MHQPHLGKTPHRLGGGGGGHLFNTGAACILTHSNIHAFIHTPEQTHMAGCTCREEAACDAMSEICLQPLVVTCGLCHFLTGSLDKMLQGGDSVMREI